ncbi:MAG: hypothetical protein ACR2P0_02985 [Acidimicrobiales bacterium]
MGTNPTSTTTRRLRALAVASILAIIATACGQGDEPAAPTVIANGVEPSGWGEPAPTGIDDAQTSEDSEDPVADAAEKNGRVFAAPADPIEAVADPGDPAVNAQVLAVAVESSESLSFTFEQGFAMEMAMGSFVIDISPDAPMMSGAVDGDRSYMQTDMGVMFEEMFSSLGIDPGTVPELAAMTEGASFEAWVDGSVMTLDMSSFVSAIGGTDPQVDPGLSVFADGPVSIDMAQLDGMNAAAISQQLGQGSQVVDPAAILESLRTVDSVAVVGTTTAVGRPVTVYRGSMSMLEYMEAMGQDLDTQLASFEGLGIDMGDDAAMLDTVFESMGELQVDVTIMVDDDGLIRRIEHAMDMGPMIEAMMSDPSLGLDGAGFGDISMSMDLWQEFDGYGDAGNFTSPPSATDVTTDFSDLLAGLVAF